MVSAGDFRKGVTVEIDGKVYVIVDFQHVKPGKGAAFVRAKIKNVVTGQVLEQTFNPSDKYENAHIERKEMQYSYNADGLYYFMDMETYDMLPLNYEIVADALRFVKEEMCVTVQSYKGAPFSVEPPNFVELEIAETEPGIQGDTSKAGNKPAKLETGYNIQVPLFINQGEKIRVDTRTGTYMERVK
ncbi:MAG: elongation factor P [Clostridia bacterium]|jgi:elongation factor P|uniref:elongation factor P n=1 Tax=Pumilibacter muris TaxID=2941510 RepID=UPI00203BA714|nr:elongation factor P [Pumilibacter muris]MCI8595968.1 elongation factor P [Clostridia bacterium]